MRTRTVETVSVVNQIKCDRCGLEVQRDEIRFGEMICIAFDAGYGSIFGDGNRVELDLCESCLRDSLGPWLRVTKPSDPPW